MKTFSTLNKLPPSAFSFALSIGVFDGMHLGHKHLLSKVSAFEKSCVLTFSNHPLEILKPNQKHLFLQQPLQKQKSFESLNIDYFFLLPFTKEIANYSFDQFIYLLREYIPFTHLILGKGSVFGKDQMGTEKRVTEMGEKEGFICKYIPKLTIDQQIISTSAIKELIVKGDFALAEKYLGYPLNKHLITTNS